MNYVEIESILKESVKKENLNFKVEFSEAFIFDLSELLKNSRITKKEIKRVLQDILKKDEKFLKTEEKYLNKLDKSEIRLLFKFDDNNRILILEHFDYLLSVKEIDGTFDYLFFWIEIIFAFFICYEFDFNIQYVWGNLFYILIMVGILILLYFKEIKDERDGKKKIIWENKDLFDKIRKRLRSGENLDLSRFFFLVRWLNICFLCMIQISSKNNNVWYMLINIIFVLLMFCYSLKHLLKVFNMSIRMVLISVIFIIIIGFFNKENWELIIIISVIINIMFSKDVIYLSNNSLFKKIEKMNKYKKKVKETKMKLIFNCILASIYLLVKFTDHSFIFEPILESNTKGENYIIQTLYIGVERIIIIAFLTIIIKSENKYFKKIKNKCLNLYQSFVNYIVIKIYLK